MQQTNVTEGNVEKRCVHNIKLADQSTYGKTDTKALHLAY